MDIMWPIDMECINIERCGFKSWREALDMWRGFRVSFDATSGDMKRARVVVVSLWSARTVGIKIDSSAILPRQLIYSGGHAVAECGQSREIIESVFLQFNESYRRVACNVFNLSLPDNWTDYSEMPPEYGICPVCDGSGAPTSGPVDIGRCSYCRGAGEVPYDASELPEWPDGKEASDLSLFADTHDLFVWWPGILASQLIDVSDEEVIKYIEEADDEG